MYIYKCTVKLNLFNRTTINKKVVLCIIDISYFQCLSINYNNYCIVIISHEFE